MAAEVATPLSVQMDGLGGSSNPDLIVHDFINSGTYGSVHYAEYKGTPVALKVIYVNQETRPYAEREVAISKRLSSHPNVIRTHAVFEHEGNKVLIQELADSGDLFDFINNHGFGHNEEALKHVFGQLVSGLAYVQSRGVSHRDLKPENIVLSNGLNAKILDFGLSDETRWVRGRVGTDPYCAPEVCRLPNVRRGKQRGRRVDGFAADVFSLGLTLVAMVTGKLPWGVADEERDSEYASFVERLLTYDVEGAVFAEDPAALGVSPHLCRLLDAMLHPDPKQRASLAAIAEYLALPWFVAPSATTAVDPAASADNNNNEAAATTTTTTAAMGGSLALARTHQLVDSGVSVGLCNGSASSDDTCGCEGRERHCSSSLSWVDDEDEGLGGDETALPPLPSFLVAGGA